MRVHISPTHIQSRAYYTMNRTTFDKSEHWQRIAEGLHDMLQFLNSARTLDEILAFVVEQACQLCEASAGVIHHFDQERRIVRQVAIFGTPSVVTSPTPFSHFQHSELYRAIQEGHPFPIPDLAEYNACRRQPSGKEQGVVLWNTQIRSHFHAQLAVPIIIKAQVYGTIELYYAKPRDFSIEEIDLALMLGNQAALAIENAQLRVASEQAAVLKERNRLARDLHDSVTQSLYSLTLLAEAARRLTKSGDLLRVAEAITRLSEIGQQVLKEMRLLVYELRPLALERVGLIKALQQRLNTVERRAGVTAHLLIKGELTLPSPLEPDLYHVIQEALNNVLKHAGATSVTVRISTTLTHLEVEVADNGKGFPRNMAESAWGIGLNSMQERIEKIGGALTIDSIPGQGSRIYISIPHQCQDQMEVDG